MAKDILIVEDRREDEAGIEAAVNSAQSLLSGPVHISHCRSSGAALEKVREVAAVRSRNPAAGLHAVVVDLQIFGDEERTSIDDSHERHGLDLLQTLFSERGNPAGMFAGWGNHASAEPFLICCTSMAQAGVLNQAESTCDVLISKNDADWQLQLARQLQQSL